MQIGALECPTCGAEIFGSQVSDVVGVRFPRLCPGCHQRWLVKVGPLRGRDEIDISWEPAKANDVERRRSSHG